LQEEIHPEITTLCWILPSPASQAIIISTLTLNGHGDIPANVKVLQVPHLEFIRLMRESDMVITPLVSGQTRSAGQQTYLNAMRMGRSAL